MALVRQPKTALFRLKSRYEYIIHRFSKCLSGIKLLTILIFAEETFVFHH